MRKPFEKSLMSEVNKKLWKKRYFLHYAGGKYYLINLTLKKKGHEQGLDKVS